MPYFFAKETVGGRQSWFGTYLHAVLTFSHLLMQGWLGNKDQNSTSNGWAPACVCCPFLRSPSSSVLFGRNNQVWILSRNAAQIYGCGIFGSAEVLFFLPPNIRESIPILHIFKNAFWTGGRFFSLPFLKSTPNIQSLKSAVLLQ